MPFASLRAFLFAAGGALPRPQTSTLKRKLGWTPSGLWLGLAISTLIAGCHGAGTAGSSLEPPLAARRTQDQVVNPVPAVTPVTACQQTDTGGANDTPKYSCFLEPNVAPTAPLNAGPTEVFSQQPNWNCTAGSFSLVYQNDSVNPQPSLPPPQNVRFFPTQSDPGLCSKKDSTTVTFTFPSPLPAGQWAVHYAVMDNFSDCDGINCANTNTDILDIWLHPSLLIRDIDANHDEIENQEWTRVVGQRVNLEVLQPYAWDDISGCNWQVPNGVAPNAVGGYGALGPTIPSVLAAPSPMPTLANVTQIQFYWVRPFDPSQLNLTCTVSNSHGWGDGNVHVAPMQISAFINSSVVAPTASVSTTFGSIHQGPYQFGPGEDEEISLGTQLDMPSSLGLQSAYSVTMPSQYGGEFGPNQTIKFSTTVSPDPSATPGTGGNVELDGCPIYTQYFDGSTIAGPVAVASAAPGASSTFSTVDAPSSSNWYQSQYLREKDDFVTTLMFKPTVDANGSLPYAIWVPLVSYAWGFDGTAEDLGAWNWAAQPSPVQYPSPGAYSTASNATLFTIPGNFPTWNGVVYTPSCASVQ